MADPCTKFEVSSISRCRRYYMGCKILKWVTWPWPRPFQGRFFIHGLGLAMVNQCTKFEVSRFTRYEAMNGGAKCRKCGGSGALKVMGNATIRYSAYDFQFDFHRNYVSIFYRFRDIAGYLTKVANFDPPQLHLVPHMGWPRSNFVEIFGNRKLQSLGYRVVLFVWSYV